MGKLYLVPTPIGNLEDMTIRAIRILNEVDLILAEDTRTSAKLLKHYGINTPLVSHHKFNEHKQVEHISLRIIKGENVALISDAGTPGLSDPGFLITRECIKKGIETECLPGATALVPALINSGLPCDRFTFEGFLPPKKGRQKRLEAMKHENKTIVLYESPYKLIKTLEQLKLIFNEEKQICIAREISKMYEEYKRGSIKEVTEYYVENPPKGEIVIIISPD